MHPFTAATIAARQAVLEILHDGGPIVINVEKKIGTHLSNKQCDAIWAALATLEAELRDTTTPAEITEARQLLTDHAYEAQEKPEVDG